MQNSAFNLMAGNFELAVGDTLIPAELLGDMSPNYEEGEISAETQAGTVTTPNGKPETSEFTFTMFLPADNAASYLGIIWPEAYNKPTAEAQKSGNLVFCSRACQSRTPKPYNIHNVCAATDDNDIFIPAGLAKIAFNPTLSTSDAVSVEVTVYMQPSEDGARFRFGTGDLAEPSNYDVTTQKTVPVTTASAE